MTMPLFSVTLSLSLFLVLKHMLNLIIGKEMFLNEFWALTYSTRDLFTQSSFTFSKNPSSVRENYEGKQP